MKILELMMTVRLFKRAKMWNDNCNHFKSAHTMVMFLGYLFALYGLVVECSQSLPGHGKGNCDRLGAVFQQLIKKIMEMIAGTMGNTAEREEGSAVPKNAETLLAGTKTHSVCANPPPGKYTFNTHIYL
jgi:hypothetical protein